MTHSAERGRQTSRVLASPEGEQLRPALALLGAAGVFTVALLAHWLQHDGDGGAMLNVLR